MDLIRKLACRTKRAWHRKLADRYLSWCLSNAGVASDAEYAVRRAKWQHHVDTYITTFI